MYHALSRRNLATALLSVVALKPAIDFAWKVRVGTLGFSTSIQGVLGIVVFFVSVLLASLQLFKRGQSDRKFRNLAALFLGTSAYLVTGILRKTTNTEFALKYVASLAGLIFIPWSFHVLKGNDSSTSKKLRWLIAATVSLVILSLFLQLLGILPWQTFDMLPVKFFGENFGSLLKVGRLTGFYYHPLDLVRSLVWVFNAMMLLYITGIRSGKTSLLMLMAAYQFLLVRTTHRSSMILSVSTMAFLFLYSRRWRPIVAIFAVTLVGWLSSALVFKAIDGVDFFTVFSPAPLIMSRPDIPETVKTSAASPHQGLGLNLAPPVNIDEAKLASAETPVLLLRGRTAFWRSHFAWLGSFSAREWLLGTSRHFPANKEAEPHNQAIDSIERFGLIGLLLICGIYLYAFMIMPVPSTWKLVALGTLFCYGMMTEVIVMPTFTWWAVLFVYAPLWLPVKKQQF